MNNKELEKGYNQGIEGKKNNRLSMILVTSFCGVITLTAIVLFFLSNLSIADKVKVVDTKGKEIPTELKRRKQIEENALKSHIEDAILYANSFSRENYKTNQNRTLMIMDRGDAYNIFEGYKKSKSYENALKLGHVQKIIKTEITQLTGDKEPFFFKSKSVLEIKDGTKIEYWAVLGEGNITYREPSYPYNNWGLWISNYRQTSNRIQNGDR